MGFEDTLSTLELTENSTDGVSLALDVFFNTLPPEEAATLGTIKNWKMSALKYAFAVAREHINGVPAGEAELNAVLMVGEGIATDYLLSSLLGGRAATGLGLLSFAGGILKAIDAPEYLEQEKQYWEAQLPQSSSELAQQSFSGFLQKREAMEAFQDTARSKLITQGLIFLHDFLSNASHNTVTSNALHQTFTAVGAETLGIYEHQAKLELEKAAETQRAGGAIDVSPKDAHPEKAKELTPRKQMIPSGPPTKPLIKNENLHKPQFNDFLKGNSDTGLVIHIEIPISETSSVDVYVSLGAIDRWFGDKAHEAGDKYIYTRMEELSKAVSTTYAGFNRSGTIEESKVFLAKLRQLKSQFYTVQGEISSKRNERGGLLWGWRKLSGGMSSWANQLCTQGLEDLQSSIQTIETAVAKAETVQSAIIGDSEEALNTLLRDNNYTEYFPELHQRLDDLIVNHVIHAVNSTDISNAREKCSAINNEARRKGLLAAINTYDHIQRLKAAQDYQRAGEHAKAIEVCNAALEALGEEETLELLNCKLNSLKALIKENLLSDNSKELIDQLDEAVRLSQILGEPIEPLCLIKIEVYLGQKDYIAAKNIATATLKNNKTNLPVLQKALEAINAMHLSAEEKLKEIRELKLHVAHHDDLGWLSFHEAKLTQAKSDWESAFTHLSKTHDANLLLHLRECYSVLSHEAEVAVLSSHLHSGVGVLLEHDMPLEQQVLQAHLNCLMALEAGNYENAASPEAMQAMAEQIEEKIRESAEKIKQQNRQYAAKDIQNTLYATQGVQLASDLIFDFLLPTCLGKKTRETFLESIQASRQLVTHGLLLGEQMLQNGLPEMTDEGVVSHCVQSSQAKAKEVLDRQLSNAPNTASAFFMQYQTQYLVARVVSSAIQLFNTMLIRKMGENSVFKELSSATQWWIYSLDLYAIANSVFGLLAGNAGLRSVLSLGSRVHLLNPWLMDEPNQQKPATVSTNALRLFCGYFLTNLNSSLVNRYTSVHGSFLLQILSYFLPSKATAIESALAASDALRFGMGVLDNLVYPIIVTYCATNTLWHMPEVLRLREIENFLLNRGVYLNLEKIEPKERKQKFFEAWLQSNAQAQKVEFQLMSGKFGDSLFEAIAYYTDETLETLKQMVSNEAPENFISVLEKTLCRPIVVCDRQCQVSQPTGEISDLKEIERPIFICFDKQQNQYHAVLMTNEPYFQFAYLRGEKRRSAEHARLISKSQQRETTLLTKIEARLTSIEARQARVTAEHEALAQAQRTPPENAANNATARHQEAAYVQQARAILTNPPHPAAKSKLIKAFSVWQQGKPPTQPAQTRQTVNSTLRLS